MVFMKNCSNDTYCQGINGTCTNKLGGLRYDWPVFIPYGESKSNAKAYMPKLSGSRVCYCNKGDYYSADYAGCVPGDLCANITTCAQDEGGLCEYLNERLKCTCPKWLNGTECSETVPKWIWREWSEGCCIRYTKIRKQICIDHMGRDSEKCNISTKVDDEEVKTIELDRCAAILIFISVGLVVAVVMICIYKRRSQSSTNNNGKDKTKDKLLNNGQGNKPGTSGTI